MASSPDNRYGYFDHETSRALDVVYRYQDASCDHSLEVFARLETSDQRWQVYQCCVICGHYSSGPLPHAQHPEFMSYPIINDDYRLSSDATPRQVRVRWRKQSIFAMGDSSGSLICDRELFHAKDAYMGRRALYLWNECINAIDARHIAPGRRKLLQYSLQEILLEGGILGAWMSTDIDLTRYEEPLRSAFNATGLRVDELYFLGLDDRCDSDLTMFGEDPTYSDYLASNQWRKNREAAVWYTPNTSSRSKRRPTCENPYCRSFASAVDCHHLTYRNVGHEQPGELIFLCRECHDMAEFFKAHSEYASRRIA